MDARQLYHIRQLNPNARLATTKLGAVAYLNVSISALRNVLYVKCLDNTRIYEILRPF